MEITFYFHLKPIPKGRPRFSRSGHCFTPHRTRNAESFIQTDAKSQMGKNPPLNGILEMTVLFQGKRPKESVIPAPPGDLDNMIKLVGDALNGIAYHDDKQIIQIGARKEWASEDLITVNIRTLNE